MARVFSAIFTLVVLSIIIQESEATSGSIPVPTNERIQAPQGGKCLNFIWDRPCDHPWCNVTLKVKLQKGLSSLTQDIPSNTLAITDDKRSFVQCIYDGSAGETMACCNRVNSGLNIQTGYSLSFSDNEKISFEVKICLNDSGNCVTSKWFNYVLPWYDPCFFENPCQNYGMCIPAVNSYNCSCLTDWKGKNCSIPNMTFLLGMCLNYSSNYTDVKHYMKTVEECRTACFTLGPSKCKSFQFKRMPDSNRGNCTLRDSNRNNYDVVPCDMDLYEFTRYLNYPNSAASVAIVTFQLLLMSLATFFL